MRARGKKNGQDNSYQKIVSIWKGVQWLFFIQESEEYFMDVLTMSEEHWVADTRYTLKLDSITILKYSMVSWRMIVDTCFKISRNVL